jgi:hypothetical protein
MDIHDAKAIAANDDAIELLVNMLEIMADIGDSSRMVAIYALIQTCYDSIAGIKSKPEEPKDSETKDSETKFYGCMRAGCPNRTKKNMYCNTCKYVVCSTKGCKRTYTVYPFTTCSVCSTYEPEYTVDM